MKQISALRAIVRRPHHLVSDSRLHGGASDQVGDAFSGYTEFAAENKVRMR